MPTHTCADTHKHTDMYSIYTHTHIHKHTGVHIHIHNSTQENVYAYIRNTQINKKQTCNAPSGSLRDTGMDTLDKSFPTTQAIHYTLHHNTPHYTHQCSYAGLSTSQCLHWPPLDWVMSSVAQLSPTGA